MLKFYYFSLILPFGIFSTIKADYNSHLQSNNAKIYKGKDAPKNKYPFYIDIHVKFPDVKDVKGELGLTNHGGGALISKAHVLTVCHIFYPGQDEKNPYKKLASIH